MPDLFNTISGSCNSELIKNLAKEFAEVDNIELQLFSFARKHQTAAFNCIWLLKDIVCTKKVFLSASLSQKLILLIPGLINDFSNLHLLQMSPYLSLNDSNLGIWEDFLEQCRKSSNKFVLANRASGFIPMARMSPLLIPEFMAECEIALNGASASMKARVNIVIKELDKIKKGA